MKTITIIMLALLVSIPAMAQPNKVTSYPPRYGGVLYQFSGLPRKSIWATSGTITGSASSARLITADNLNGIDTLYFAISTSDTAATKKYRLYPGQTLNEWWSFTNDVALFWRVPTDSTKQIKVIMR